MESLHYLFNNLAFIPSFGYWLYTCSISFIIIKIVEKSNIPNLLKTCLLECLAGFLLVGGGLENSHMYVRFGMFAYLGASILSGTALTKFYPEGYFGTPLPIFRKYFEMQINLKKSIIAIMCQLIGGVVAKYYHTYTWCSLVAPYSSWHQTRLLCAQEYSNCACSALGVSIINGFFIELFGTFTLGTLKYLCEIGFFKSISPIVTVSFIKGASAFCLYYGYHKTGFYLNPLNAISQQFLCSDVDLMSHLVVYWIAPLLATKLLHIQSEMYTIPTKKID